MAHLLSVDGPGDVIRGPFHLISVPVFSWIKVLGVRLSFLLTMTVAVDHVCGERAILNRWHDFNIELVPSVSVEAGTVPICEEGLNCALAVWTLRTGHKFSISELLVGREGSTLEVGCSEADNRD